MVRLSVSTGAWHLIEIEQLHVHSQVCYKPWLEEEAGLLVRVDCGLNCAQDRRHGSEPAFRGALGPHHSWSVRRRSSSSLARTSSMAVNATKTSGSPSATTIMTTRRSKMRTRKRSISMISKILPFRCGMMPLLPRSFTGSMPRRKGIRCVHPPRAEYFPHSTCKR